MKLGLLARALLVYGVALVLRLRNVKAVLIGKRVLFDYDDPCYHLRRILLTLEQFPKVPTFDSYMNFPSGAVITWPPGFDLLVAAFAWLAGLGHPSRHRIEATAALLIPFLGAIAAMVVMLLAEEIVGRGRWEAFAAGLLYAFLPAQQEVSTVGRLDHHVLEMTAFGLALLFFLRAIRDDPGSRHSFWGGLALAGGVFCSLGSILFGGFIAAFGILQLALDRFSTRPDAGTGRSALRVLFWGGLLLVPLVALFPGEGRRSLTFVMLSWYQPALFLVGAFLVAALSGAIYAPADRRGKRRALTGFFLSALLVAGGTWLLIRGSGGIAFLTHRNPIIQLITETWPIWKVPPGQVLADFSRLIYLAPVAAAALLWVVARGRFSDVRLNLLLVLLLFTATLGVLQFRYLNYFAAPFCIVLMWGFREIVDAVRERITVRPLRWSAIAACSLALAVPFSPTLRASFHSLPADRAAGTEILYPAFQWIREHTPKTSHYMNPDRQPEYGILADFSFGHGITTIGERPNFANPFSLAPWHEKPIVESARLFLMEEEKPLLEALDRNRLRYVLLFNNENALEDYALLVGLPADEFVRIGPDGRRNVPTPRFFRTFGVRLALADGSEYEASGETIPALTGFRLVHESEQMHWRYVPGLPDRILTSHLKIFERVAGYRLEGMTGPGGEVTVQVPVTTDAGRRFDYFARTRSDAGGRFNIVVPYASGKARVTLPDCTLEASVSEEEVESGARRPIRCP